MMINELIEKLDSIRKVADIKAERSKSQEDFIRYGIDAGMSLGLQQALFYVEMYKTTSELEQKLKEGSND